VETNAAVQAADALAAARDVVQTGLVTTAYQAADVAATNAAVAAADALAAARGIVETNAAVQAADALAAARGIVETNAAVQAADALAAARGIAETNAVTIAVTNGTLNSTTAHPGTIPALSGNATDFLNGTGAFGVPAGGSLTLTAEWATTNDVLLTDSYVSYALAALPSVHGRRVRIVNQTTNTSCITATLAVYDTTSNLVDRLTVFPESNLARANSVSNAAAGVTSLWVTGLNAINESLLEVDSDGQTTEWAQLKSLASTVVSAWSTNGGHDGAQETILFLATYNGKLYAGQGAGAGDGGDVLVFDGTTWSTSYNGAQETIFSLAAYNGKLYAGQGTGAGDGDVFTMTTHQLASIESVLTYARTNYTVSAVNQFPVGALATNMALRLSSDNIGSQITNTVRITTEVMR
jgi:hypothetical protein